MVWKVFLNQPKWLCFLVVSFEVHFGNCEFEDPPWVSVFSRYVQLTLQRAGLSKHMCSNWQPRKKGAFVQSGCVKRTEKVSLWHQEAHLSRYAQIELSVSPTLETYFCIYLLIQFCVYLMFSCYFFISYLIPTLVYLSYTNTEPKGKISSLTHAEIFQYCLYVYNLNTERTHKYFSTARNMHILFYEQAVYKRGTETMALLFNDREGNKVSTVQRIEAKESENGFLKRYVPPNEHAHF